MDGRSFLHAEKDVNFAAKELVSRVLSHDCREVTGEEVKYYGTVVPDLEEYDDVEEIALGSGCPLFQDNKMISMLLFILSGDILENRTIRYR